MNRAKYNKLQYEAKKSLREGIKRFKELYPERYAELQRKALESDNIVAKPPPPKDLDRDLRIWRAGRKDYFIHTKDTYGNTHTYFETLISPHEAEQVLSQLHPSYTERDEKINDVVACTCPLCTA